MVRGRGRTRSSWLLPTHLGMAGMAEAVGGSGSGSGSGTTLRALGDGRGEGKRSPEEEEDGGLFMRFSRWS